MCGNAELLRDEVALVTGGGRGIGAAIAKELAQLGATVVVNDLPNSPAAEEMAAEIIREGGSARTACFDISSEEAVEKGIKQIVDDLGRIDILVNNAGISIDGLLVRTKLEEWQRTLNVNLTGAFLCSRAVSKSMIKAKKGRIVNIGSVIGSMGNVGQCSYSASKAGLLGFSRSLARELGSRGVTVNVVAPGFIATDMTDTMSEENRERLLASVPLKRLGTAQDVANAVAFLVLPQSGYITGEVLHVNGGLYM